MNDLIGKLSEIRSNYNCMDEKEEPYYRALSEAIQLVSADTDLSAYSDKLWRAAYERGKDEARPERGEWIRWYETKEDEMGTEYIPHCKCSECGTEYDPHSSKFVSFCNVCGAKMEEGKQDK